MSIVVHFRNFETNGDITCTCGATCTNAKDRNRFLKRHPALCSKREEITKSLATGVKCVDDEERQRLQDIHMSTRSYGDYV